MFKVWEKSSNKAEMVKAHKENRRIKGKGLTRTNEAKAMFAEPRNRSQQWRKLRKNGRLRTVPEGRSKQGQIRRGNSFQREKEQEDRMKK